MELRFRVMAKSKLNSKSLVIFQNIQRSLLICFQGDAHIALTTSPLVLNPLYEIVIGASGNNYTDLRRTMTGRSVSVSLFLVMIAIKCIIRFEAILQLGGQNT